MNYNYTTRTVWILAATVVAIAAWVWGGYYILGDIWFENQIPFLFRSGPQSWAFVGALFILISGLVLVNLKGKSVNLMVPDVEVPASFTYSIFSSTPRTPLFLHPLNCAIFISIVVSIFLGLILIDVSIQSFVPVWILIIIVSIVFFSKHFKLYKGHYPVTVVQRFTFRTVSLFYGPLFLLVCIAIGLGFIVSGGKTLHETFVAIFYLSYLFILGMSIVPRSAEKAGISPFDLPCPRITYALSKLGAMLLYTTIISGSMYILVIAFMWGSACLNKGC